MKISEVIALYPNFGEAQTGGGCTAYRHPLGESGQLLITDAEDPVWIPEDDATEVMCGSYADDESDGECIVIPVEQVGAWIDAQLSIKE